MKKAASLLLVLAVCLGSAFQQTVTAQDSIKSKREFKNTIHFNITNPIIFGGRSLIFGYERVLNKRRSFTINVGEADDAKREAIRTKLHEPYRTMLGHMRHESGHYYWARLLENTRWHEPFRQLFGDEREDYAAALKKHYDKGPDPAWPSTHVSAYASAHPWEDWAETWAHYLHMVDTLDIAMDSGIHGDHLDLLKDPFDADVLYRFEGEEEQPDDEFLTFFNSWTGLTSVLNELSLGMGLRDFYPFVLSNPCITKLHFVHRFIKDYRLSQTAQPPGGAT